jgi:hypothetical protein
MADGHSHLIDFPEGDRGAPRSRGRPEDRPRARGGAGRRPDRRDPAAGLAARERGDVPAAVQRISQAMQEVAALAAHAEGAAEVMRARSGSVLHSKKAG